MLVLILKYNNLSFKMNLIKIHFVHNVLSMKNHASATFFLNEIFFLAMRNLKQDMIIFNQIKGMSK